MPYNKALHNKIIIKNNKEVVEEICIFLINSQIIVFENGVPFIRYNNYYRQITEKELIQILFNLVNESDRLRLRSSVYTEVYKRIKNDDRLQINISKGFYDSQFYLNLSNGVYSIKEKRLIEGHRNLIFDYILNFNYIPNASINNAPAFKNYIRTSIGEEGLECLLRATAYCFSSLTQGRVAIVLQGKGQTGKSVWLLLLEHIIDASLRSNVSFQDMAKQEYLIKLMGKRVNICTDVDSAPIKNEGIFKRITASEQVTARDLFQSAVDFRPTLKLIACTNSELSFKHPDDEVYDQR